MFEVNDIVLYNRTDVCRIEVIRNMPFMGDERIDYYVLKPVYEESSGSSTLYVPITADENRLRRAFSAQELKDMLNTDVEQVEWIENSMLRKKAYNDILSRNHPAELIGLIRTMQQKSAEKMQAGQKLSESDEKYLTSAEKRLFPLFKYILNTDWDTFLNLILQ